MPLTLMPPASIGNTPPMGVTPGATMTATRRFAENREFEQSTGFARARERV